LPLLAFAMRHPRRLADLTAGEWDIVLRQARLARVEGRLADEVAANGVWETVPPKARDALANAKALCQTNRHQLEWEVTWIERALRDLDIDVVLLKGAAYAAADLPPARARLSSDVDILVPRQAIPAVEAALLAAGWEHASLDTYDQRYYRQWMHELPPLRHRDRGTVVDVHHTILPLSGRLRPDPALLTRGTRRTRHQRFTVFAPPIMALHAMAHLVQDGDLRHAIRDVADIHDLLGHFAHEPGFWPALVTQARDLELTRPLFYGLRLAQRMMGTEVPADVVAAVDDAAPPRPLLAMMDWAAPLVLFPAYPARPSRRVRLARLALYMRSHWLRMPPLLLARHLGRKAWHRVVGDPHPTGARADP
jgi:hypothetical protein